MMDRPLYMAPSGRFIEEGTATRASCLERKSEQRVCTLPTLADGILCSVHQDARTLHKQFSTHLACGPGAPSMGPLPGARSWPSSGWQCQAPPLLAKAVLGWSVGADSAAPHGPIAPGRLQREAFGTRTRRATKAASTRRRRTAVQFPASLPARSLKSGCCGPRSAAHWQEPAALRMQHETLMQRAT